MKLVTLLIFCSLALLTQHCGKDNEHSKAQPSEEPIEPPPPAEGPALKDGDPVVDVDSAAATDPARYLVEREWVSGPVRGEGNELKLVIGDTEGYAPDTTLALSLKVVMKCCGSNAEQRNLEIKKQDNDYTFKLKHIDLPMAGTWKLDVSIKASGKKKGKQAEAAHLRFEETVR